MSPIYVICMSVWSSFQGLRIRCKQEVSVDTLRHRHIRNSCQIKHVSWYCKLSVGTLKLPAGTLKLSVDSLKLSADRLKLSLSMKLVSCQLFLSVGSNSQLTVYQTTIFCIVDRKKW